MAISQDRAHILAVAAGDAIGTAAASDPLLLIEEAPSLEAAAARLRHTPPLDLIVLGSALNAGHAGERLLAIDGKTPLLFMIRPDRLARFRAGLPFMPRLGQAWSAADDLNPSDLRQLMHDAVASARGRTDFGIVISRINSQLTGTSATSDPRLNQRRLSERYFTTLLSTAPDAFLALDVRGRLTAFNDAAAELFSIGDQLGEVALGDFVPESARAELGSLLARTLAGEVIRLAVLPLRTAPDSRGRWIELSLARVPAKLPTRKAYRAPPAK